MRRSLTPSDNANLTAIVTLTMVMTVPIDLESIYERSSVNYRQLKGNE